ncbi:MAG: RluA family pseudouridine synthase [Chloroflexi bacterium]|nr:RluA family pseudouridine synthase [Chloroflexota bacterium]
MEEQHIVFTADTPGERLDMALVMNTDGLSRGQLQVLIHAGKVTVNGKPAKPSLKLKGGEHIRVSLPPPAPDSAVAPEEIALKVVYEDDDLAVIDKPAGLVVHPGDGNERGTLVNALLARWPQIAQMPYDARRRGIVHRLDKDTSGLLVIAKNAPAQLALAQQFAQRQVEKSYLALVERPPKTPSGQISAPIGRDPAQRKRMAVVRGGKPALSAYRVLDAAFPGGQALLEVTLLTGRTHQIRVHLAFIGCPIVGDRVYGLRKPRLTLGRHFLHAARLAFDQPTSGQRLTFESPLPPELQTLLRALKG